MQENIEENIEEKNNPIKPEIVSIKPEQNMETQIDSTLGQVGQKSEKFEDNLTSLGGPEGVKKVWSELDEGRKQEILTKIKELSEKKHDAIVDQSIGFDMMNPYAFMGDMKLNQNHSNLEGFVLYFAGAPVMGAGFLAKATLDRIKIAIQSKREKSKLKKLKNKYS